MTLRIILDEKSLYGEPGLKIFDYSETLGRSYEVSFTKKVTNAFRKELHIFWHLRYQIL